MRPAIEHKTIKRAYGLRPSQETAIEVLSPTITTPRVGRRLAAIVAADVAGYSRLMGLDEVGTARTLREHRKVTDALVAKHGGVVKTTGAGVSRATRTDQSAFTEIMKICVPCSSKTTKRKSVRGCNCCGRSSLQYLLASFQATVRSARSTASACTKASELRISNRKNAITRLDEGKRDRNRQLHPAHCD
jgi:class 3 adenylate cyclase